MLINTYIKIRDWFCCFYLSSIWKK